MFINTSCSEVLYREIFTTEWLEFLLKCVVGFLLKRALTHLLALISRWHSLWMFSFGKHLLPTHWHLHSLLSYLQRHYLHWKPQLSKKDNSKFYWARGRTGSTEGVSSIVESKKNIRKIGIINIFRKNCFLKLKIF